MRHYELVTILSPMLNQDQAAETWGKIKDFIASRDAEIVNEQSWGTRRLAYPIHKGAYNFLEGNYYLTQFSTERPFNQELHNFLRLDEQVIRSLIIATGPPAPPAPPRRVEPVAQAQVEPDTAIAATATPPAEGEVEPATATPPAEAEAEPATTTPAAEVEAEPATTTPAAEVEAEPEAAAPPAEAEAEPAAATPAAEAEAESAAAAPPAEPEAATPPAEAEVEPAAATEPEAPAAVAEPEETAEAPVAEAAPETEAAAEPGGAQS